MPKRVGGRETLERRNMAAWWGQGERARGGRRRLGRRTERHGSFMVGSARVAQHGSMVGPRREGTWRTAAPRAAHVATWKLYGRGSGAGGRCCWRRAAGEPVRWGRGCGGAGAHLGRTDGRTWREMTCRSGRGRQRLCARTRRGSCEPRRWRHGCNARAGSGRSMCSGAPAGSAVQISLTSQTERPMTSRFRPA